MQMKSLAEGTQNTSSSTHLCQAPQFFPPDLVSGLVKCSSDAKASSYSMGSASKVGET